MCIRDRDVFIPLVMLQFFKVTLVLGVIPMEPIRTTPGVVTLVLAILRFLEVDPLFEPSMMT